MTRTQLNEQIRAEYLPKIVDFFNKENDVCVIASNKIAIPVVDSEGNEKWVTITVSVPTDTEFDGYTEATFYSEKIKLKEVKAKERKEAAEARQRAIEQKRAQKAEALIQ